MSLPIFPLFERRTLSGTSVVNLNFPALLIMIIWSTFGGSIGVRARPRVLTGKEMLMDVFGIRVKPVTDALGHGMRPKLYCACNVWWLIRATSFYRISIVKIHFHSTFILIPRYFHSRHICFHRNSIVPTCFHFASNL